MFGSLRSTSIRRLSQQTRNVSGKAVFPALRVFRKTGVLEFSPSRPTLQEGKSYMTVKKPGSIFVSASPILSAEDSKRSYDYSKKISVALSVVEVGDVLNYTGAQPLTFQRPVTDSESGVKTLVFSKPEGKSYHTVTISTPSASGEMQAVPVVISEGELTVVKKLLEQSLPGMLAWSIQPFVLGVDQGPNDVIEN